MAPSPLLTIVMPALNEENNIRAAIDNTLNAFKDFSIDGELIVIDDGSTDATPVIIEDLISKHLNIHVIRHETPQGIGASFWDGVDHAKGNFLCMLPGDNENNPWEIMRYIRLLEHVDIVIPFVFNKEKRSLFRNLLSFTYRFIINSTFLVNFNYTNGTVMYRKSILMDLQYRSHGFFFQTDILVRIVKKGYLFSEVPYQLGVRNDGVSKAVTFPSLIQVINGYVMLVKDIYYGKNRKIGVEFIKDSLTARRQGNITE